MSQGGLRPRWVAALAVVASWMAGLPTVRAASATPADCAVTVVEVRGGELFLSRAADCLAPVAAGQRLRAVGGGRPALRVVAVSSRWILAAGAGWKVGQQALIEAPPSPGVATPPRRTRVSAGPGARSRVLPPETWRSALAERPLVPVPARAGASASERGFAVHGRLEAGAVALFDRSERDAGFVRPYVRSHLQLTRPAGLPLTSAHRAEWRRRFRYTRTAQPWDDRYPEWAVRELRVSYGFLEDRLTATAGRFVPPGVAGAETVDGAGLEGQVTPDVAIGAYGGLLPEPTSLLPGVSAGAVGAYVRGRYESSTVSLRGTLLVGGSSWKGDWDTTHVDGLLSLRAGRWFDLYTSARALVDSGFNPLGRPPVDLARTFVVARGRPTDGVEFGLRYVFFRPTVTRRTLALWHEPYTTTGEPLHGVGLTARFEPLAGLVLSAEADVDVQDRQGLGLRAAGRVRYTLPIATRPELEAHYGFDDGQSLRAHVAGGAVRASVSGDVWLELAYRYRRATYRALGGSTTDEHDTRFVLDWQALGALHGWLELEWWTGDEVENLLAMAHVGWRF